jgi:hypothetical protein
MTEQSQSETIDDLLADDPVESAPAESIDIDLAIDIGDLELELAADRREPLSALHDPITGGIVNTSDIQLTTVSQALEVFQKELKRAALKLAEGTTKTRRLTAVVDGETRTVEVHLPSDDWPERELGVFAAWCNRDDAPKELKEFYKRCVREKPKVERSPILKETKKLASETFPDGSVLAEAKEKLLRINKGSAHKLPYLKMQGDTLSPFEQKRFGDGDDE